MLTKSQIRKIQEIIKRRFLAFTYEALGERALTKDEIKLLKRAGLLRSSVKNMIGDPYVLGKIVAITDRKRGRELDYKTVLKLVEKNAKPMTQVERLAIDYAKDHAGQYIQGIGDAMAKDAAGIVARRQMEAIRTEVVSAIEERKTTSELKTALFDAVDDKYRDWQRVASTEMNDAIQNGIFQGIKESSDEGNNQLVYKRPSPDACKYCKAVYLREDGFTPKIFKLSELIPSNIGRKAANWGPTIGSVHPWCQCQLHPVLDGFDFEKRRVVAEGFTARGKQYKPGQIVEDGEFTQLSAAQKKNLKWDAILTYTGKTGSHIKKSVEKLDFSENECICGY